MRALLRKELVPFLAPASVGALLFTGVYVVAFDVEKTLLAPPSNALPVIIFAALCCGALLGYAQLAVERHGDTLSYLLHRDQAPGKVLAAKCLAGWVLLAIVVHVPFVLCALWERAVSPLGPVVQWPRVGELAVAGVACVPAHALGLLCGTLRSAPGWRTALLLLLAAGLGLVIAVLLGLSFAGPGVSRLVYAASLVLLGAGVLGCVLERLIRVEDAQRAPPARTLAALGLLFCLLIGAPAAGCLMLFQDAWVSGACAGEPDLVWRADLGVVRVVLEHGREVVHLQSGEVVDHYELLGPGRRDLDTSSPESRLVRVWASDRARPLGPTWLPSGVFGFPSIAPPWEELWGVDFCERRGAAPGSSVMVGGVKTYFDYAHRRLVVFYASSWPHPEESFRDTTDVFEDGPPTLRALPRGDGRPFSPSVVFDYISSSSTATRGELTFGPHTILLRDLADETLWSLDLVDPAAVFVRAAVAERPTPAPSGAADPVQVVSAYPALDQAPVLAVVEGDHAAHTVRIVDRETGETLLEQRYGPLGGGKGLLVPLGLLGSNLLQPPAVALAAHLASPLESGWDVYDPLAGVLTARGRRPLLVAAGFALSCALAWLAERSLARRGAERWRRLAWGTALVLLGPLAWLAYITLEPRAPRSATVRTTPRRVLVVSEEGARA